MRWSGNTRVTALYTIPPAILILVVMRYGPDNAKGIRHDEEEQDEAVAEAPG